MGSSAKLMTLSYVCPTSTLPSCASDAIVNVLRKALEHLKCDHLPVDLGCTWSGTWSRSYTWSASTSLQKENLLYFASKGTMSIRE